MSGRAGNVRFVLVVSAPLGLTACNVWQSALDAHGQSAEAVLRQFYGFTALSAGIWLLVIFAMIGALRRRRSLAERLAAPLERRSRPEAFATIAVSTAIGLTAAILIGLTTWSFMTGRTLASLRGRETLTLLVTGDQWWWQVRYEDSQANRTFTTANEIHIPVGQPVKVKLESNDVIHSFWVPSLAGKEDLIPGHQNEIYLKAERPGVYRGQCAEFCGYQHAHMSFLVVADEIPDFEAWRSRQVATAASPTGEEAAAGQRVFLSRGCSICHTVRGTPAGGKVGPDLTHVASRKTVAAGTLPLSRGSLAAWIADPQAIKPGTNMPRVALDPDELNAVVAYVAGLQ
ncbi:cytochrome c oxidase subunit II [Mesorhizobium sp. BR1-1-16]|uniref:cytochrome c oxidase subunit II n=1 Tax=Mesorhizobium sp. BR1-1-16 TaxID=2876653 RepID=UPI001CCB16A6|nr:cytochrome c oxidase subunit II [Mesorhizobium sp. BR1-1-16]MBZ9936990.1 cytochrome c oxidase subunit II [Mesorhizobium sp. BR1-1-16]